MLRGVTIGEKSITGVASVVTGDIPAGIVSAGNPCKVMREITKSVRNKNKITLNKIMA